MVTDTARRPLQTGPITIHCAAMLSAQCNDSRGAGDTETTTTVMTTRRAGSVVGPRAVRSVRYRPPAPRPAGPPAIERERASHRYSRRRAGGRAAGPLTNQRAKHKRRCTVMTDVAGGGRRSASTCRRQQSTVLLMLSLSESAERARCDDEQRVEHYDSMHRDG